MGYVNIVKLKPVKINIIEIPPFSIVRFDKTRDGRTYIIIEYANNVRIDGNWR